MGAVRAAAIRAGTIDIARIRAALDNNRLAIGTPAFAQTGIMFHRAIVAVNPVFLTLHDMFVSEILGVRPAERVPAAHDRLASAGAVMLTLLADSAMARELTFGSQEIEISSVYKAMVALQEKLAALSSGGSLRRCIAAGAPTSRQR